MSVEYGFYNSVDGDRKYNARHLNTLFNGIISEGVFSTVYNQFNVTPTDPLSLGCRIDTGKAWFNNTWLVNDDIITISDISTVTGSNQSRIDMVYINIDTINRVNSIQYREGEQALYPSKPTYESGKEYPIAYITIKGSNNVITADNIEYMVGKELPLVTGLLQQMTSEQLIAQWDASFNTWFDEIKGQLSGDVATNLQNQITNMITYGTTPLSSSDTIAGDLYFQYEE